MIDLLNNELNVGDKIVFLPKKKSTKYEIQYGIISGFSKNNNKAYCYSLNNNGVCIRNSNMIVKL